MIRFLRFFQRHRFGPKPLYFFSLVVLLYAVVDGIILFFMPILAKEYLGSMLLVGLVLASSSFWNIVADLFLGLRSKPIDYRILTKASFLLMLALIGINLVPIGHIFYVNLGVLLLSMALWGFYFESMLLSTYDFVVVHTDKGEQAGSFGVIGVFRSLGYVIGPIIAGLAILASDSTVLFSAALFSLLGLAFFSLKCNHDFPQSEASPPSKRLNLRTELKIWEKIGRRLFPLLLITFSLGVYTGVVFSMTPILVETKPGFPLMGGFIVAAFFMPMILFAGLFGSLADKYGKRPFILGGAVLIILALSIFGAITDPWLAMAMALLAGTGMSLLYPSLEAQHASYIEDHLGEEEEVLGEMGVTINLGFIFGAAMAGFLVYLTGQFWLAYVLVSVMFVITSLTYFFLGKKPAFQLED